MLRKELGDEYLASIQTHLTELKFRKGVLLSAELGESNEGVNYVLRQAPVKEPNWLKRILGKGPPGYTFHLAARRGRGADPGGDAAPGDQPGCACARPIRRSRPELFQDAADGVGLLYRLPELHGQLVAKGEPVCFPAPAPAGERSHRFSGLYDVCLALPMENRVVGNTVNADGKSLVIITGANQGGKSSFLRSIGLAQVMMQCGMFVGAEAFKPNSVLLCYSLQARRGRDDEEREVR